MSYTPARRAAAVPLVIAMLTSLISCRSACAQATHWINPGADNWFNAANWSFGVPQPGSFARINDGGFVLLFDPGGTAAFLDLGFNSPSLLTVSGPGNLTLGGGRLSVYTGTLRIQNGGWLDVVDHPTLGNSTEIGSSGTGTVIVTGANSLLRSGSLYLGINGTGNSSGSGNLRIENGGWVDTVFSARLGAAVSATTSAVVTGTGSRWNVVDGLSVQGGGSSTVTIADHGTISAGGTTIGQNGVVTVTGSGSSLSNSYSANSLIVGYFGAVALNVQNGGLVTSPNAVIGSGFTGFNGIGTATITGAGSLWNVGQSLFVGGDGNTHVGSGVMRVQSSGLVQASLIRVSNTGSVEVDNGSATVAGLAISGGAAAPNLSNLGDLSIGVNSNGRMTVTSGGDVWTATGQIGRNSGRTGSATVQGAGSTWNNSGDMLVGGGGTGTLEIRSGAAVSNFRAHVGFNANSSGSVIVSDPGSSWTGSGSFFIGNGGSGSLQVLNGATASTAGNGYLGFSTFSQGFATIGGAGSTWNVANAITIGGNLTDAGGPFSSTLRIESGGIVNAASTILHDAGVLELTESAMLNSPISSRGGLIRTFNAATHAGNISLDAGNLSVTCSTLNATAMLSGVLSGPGGLTKSGFGGSGTLRLTANNTYAGPTTIHSGTLLVDGSIASSTTVNSGGTLGGIGSVGPVTIMSGGAIAPGNGIGQLTSGNVSFRGGGSYALDLRSASSGIAGTDWDSLSIDGTLDITTLSAAEPFNLRLRSLNDVNQASPLAGWNPGVDYTWPSVISTTGGLIGEFDSSLFRVDTTNFLNPVHGVFELVPDGNNFNLRYDATDVTDGVLVTNLDQPLRYATPIGNNPNPVDPPEGPGAPWYWAAQQFQSDGLFHQLVSVEARVGNGSTEPPPVIVAELHADNDGAIGDLIGTFTAPDVSGAPSALEFLPEVAMTLDPGAKYWFVLGSATPGDGTFAWEYINTNLAAGSGVIGNFADSDTSGTIWNYHGSLFPYYLQVNVLTSIPGDFNGDNTVDAADYVVIRNGPGDVQAEFDEWRANFGAMAGSGSQIAENSSVPEPTSIMLVILAPAGAFLRLRRAE